MGDSQERDRCPICDRPRFYFDGVGRPRIEDICPTSRTLCYRLTLVRSVSFDAVGECEGNAVDWRARCLEAVEERDQFREDGITGAAQNRIRDAVEVFTRVRTPGVTIDGSGCDSGDPVDLTISEVTQGLNAFDDALYDCEQERDAARFLRAGWRRLAVKRGDEIESLNRLMRDSAAALVYRASLYGRGRGG